MFVKRVSIKKLQFSFTYFFILKFIFWKLWFSLLKNEKMDYFMNSTKKSPTSEVDKLLFPFSIKSWVTLPSLKE